MRTKHSSYRNLINAGIGLFTVLAICAGARYAAVQSSFNVDKEDLFPENPALVNGTDGCHAYLRSKGDTTQLLLIRSENVLTLYTDRRNRKDSDIKAVSYSRSDSLRRNAPLLTQGEFKVMIEDALVFGAEGIGSGGAYSGLDAFLSGVITSPAVMKKKGPVITVRLEKDGGADESVLRIDALRRSCSIRVCRKSTAAAEPHCRYPVYINETNDTHLIRILRHYYYLLYERNK